MWLPKGAVVAAWSHCIASRRDVGLVLPEAVIPTEMLCLKKTLLVRAFASKRSFRHLDGYLVVTWSEGGMMAPRC